MKADTPIGIFDSGIGGLTVASAIHQNLPNRRIIYFGDTVHLPYGDKSPASIRGYIRNITTFLQKVGCETLVVACNSASSVLNDSLIAPGFTKIINVIDPVVEQVIENPEIKKIGVIGTKRTMNSHVYRDRLRVLNPDLLVRELATPLLAPMIEEGFIRDSIAEAVIHEYLDKLGPVDALILGCTHYPLIRKQIDRYYDGKIKLFDAPDRIVALLKNTQEPAELQNQAHQFYVSDFTKSFEETARMFFGESIHLEEKRLQE